jgi:uncharacterized membrane protein
VQTGVPDIDEPGDEFAAAATPHAGAFPHCLIFASVGLDWVGYWLRLANLTRAGFFLLVLGAAGAGVSALSGPDHATGDKSVTNLLVLHQSFALVTVALAVGLFLVRFFAVDGIGGRWALVYLAATLALPATLSLTGYYGGELTYHHAVGVTTSAVQSSSIGGSEGGALVPVKPMVALIGLITVGMPARWLMAGKSLAAAYYAQWQTALRTELAGAKGSLWSLWRCRGA